MFEPVSKVVGLAAPLPLVSIDTDVIIRIDRLTMGHRAELGRWAFESLRYLPDGSENDEFALNRPAWRTAPILIAGANFGCGSSREGAVTALLSFGIRCIIAQSFGDIFFANCFQNGLLPIRLDQDEVDRLMMEAQALLVPFTVDLNTQIILTPENRIINFHVDQHRREALLAGLDDIQLTLRDAGVIEKWQAQDRVNRAWAWAVEHLDSSPPQP